MQTFKKGTLFVVVNIIVGIVFSTLFTQPSSVRILVSEASSGDYDTLILGQSHAETSIDPYALSDEMQCNAFDLARRVMPVLQQYYLLLEANQHHSYKTVIFDIDPTYWDINHRRNAGRDTNLFWNLTGERRLDYFLHVSLEDNYNDVLFDYSLTALKTPDIDKVVKTKLSREYREKDSSAIELVNETVGVSVNYEYIGRGYRYGKSRSKAKTSPYTFTADRVNEECLKYFSMMVKYCKKNGIQLICVQSALPPVRLQSDNMEDVHEYFTELCHENDVPFYDMNYVKKEYLGQKDSDFVDEDGHMMGEFSQKHTRVLSEILQSDDPDTFFYADYQEVLNNLQGKDE